ncbi:3-phosphoglycerate dehydrogenase [Pullulanibacillus camelliae]|uniref:3-phosphoglycerate dehydrogenase n=1 Tax=Pullulanibacillus camelliae TaxID=1707096 RepID=A0A8J2VJ49_9BACL|nr:D-2-hydroxyacid dehydrogenase [Pullulanibacillus camelliae]GGE26537.1 3-phosphoglycerate dehydrogenase [Pullulanibacillus camelliae]
MAKRTLIVAQDLKEDLKKALLSAVPDWEVYIGKDRSSWEDRLHQAEIIAGWQKSMEEPCLKEPSQLKWIQSWSAGVDSYPLDLLESKHIALTSANGVHAYSISETIFAMMLGLTRKINTYVKQQLERKWAHGGLKLEIHEKTIGIIGVGAIGKETAKIAKAFGMKVIGVRHSGKPEEYVDQMVKSEQLNTILPQCDYVVSTVPLTKETYQLFTKEQFDAMKSSAFFINIGRGETVKEADLIQALQEGAIAGAGLDVFETEPLESESPLWSLDNVIITPHSAGSTERYNDRVIKDIFLPNLQHYLKGEALLINLVDYHKGY